MCDFLFDVNNIVSPISDRVRNIHSRNVRDLELDL